ncbi:hypothetical protein AAC387_Pa01g3895 [Persea americana]
MGKRKVGRELISREVELYHLGVRTRERFLKLFDGEYHPDTFTIKATQVPCSSASAVAFGIGLFSGKGSLRQGRHAFAFSSAFITRYQLNFTRQDVDSLWFLCKEEASLLDIIDQSLRPF